MKKIIPFVLIIIIIVLVALFFNRESPYQIESNETQADGVEIVADNLYVPWSMKFLPNGDMIVTQRNGILKIIGQESTEINVPGVNETSEGGLLGVELHPNFESNSYVYLYFTSTLDGRVINKIVRYILEENNVLSEDLVIVDNIPGGNIHNGGRIIFGPDGMLYVTTGDAGNRNLAQDTSSFAGKILRVHDDGSVPLGNPFENEIYSFGHRNPQGLAWDSQGNLWQTEHGQSGFDEINNIKIGENYGWPLIEGNQSREGMNAPVIHSGPTTTWAPSGIVFRDSKLYFVGLRGQAVYETEVLGNSNLGEVITHAQNEYGRLRGIMVGPDNRLYITTSNRDGRGTVRSGDDKIIKLTL